MSLLKGRNYYKPFEYPWAYQYFKEQNQNHWMEEELTFGDDVSDFNKKLNDDERLLLRNIFKFFTQADSDVQDGYMDHYGPIFKPPEIRMMIASFNNMEGIHKSAYSVLLETLGLPEDEYKMFMEYGAMVDKHEFLANFGTDTVRDLALTLAVFSAFTEGVQLFSSFAILMNFPRHNLMKSMGQVVSWSIRDETLHVKGMSQVFRTLIEENPEIWDDKLKFEIYSAAERVIELEDNFIDTVFKNVKIPDLTPEDVKAHIRYIADGRLLDLGLKTIFNQRSSPLSHWLDPMVSGIEHTNFFENRATEYSKGATQGNWKDIFPD